MSLAQHASLSRDDVFGDGDGIVEAAECLQVERVVVSRGQRVRVIGAQVALAPERDGLLQGCRFGEPGELTVDDGQALPHGGGICGIIALQRHVDGQRLLVERLGAGEVAAIAPLARDVPQQLRDLRAALAALFPLDRERFLVHRARFIVSALFVERVGDLRQRLGGGNAVRSVASACGVRGPRAEAAWPGRTRRASGTPRR